MVRINLLPWRGQARTQRKRRFILMLAAGIVLGAAIIAYWHWHNAKLLDQQKERNRYLQQETQKASKQVQEIKDLEKVKKQLFTRIGIVAGLQASRPRAVHLFDELVDTTPDGVYLTGVSQKGDEITVLGFAQSNANISAYMRNIESSAWLGAPVLQIIEQKAAKNNQGASSFKLIMQQTTPGQEQGQAK